MSRQLRRAPLDRPLQAHQTAGDFLFDRFKPWGGLTLVLDRWSGDPLLDAAESESSDTAQKELAGLSAEALPLQDEMFDEAPWRSPVLLRLNWGNPTHLAALDWSLHHAHAGLLHCAWLHSSATSAQLQIDLSKKLEAELHPLQRMYLRWFDPRVMPRLAQILEPDAFAQFLAPIEHWFQLDRDGALLQIRQPAEPATGAPARALRLATPESSQAVLRVAALSRTASALTLLGQVLTHADNERIDCQIQAAQAYGLDDDNQVAFATLALSQGTAFTAHPDLAQWCQLSAEHGLPFADVAASHPNPECA